MAQCEAVILRRQLDRVVGRRGPCFPADLRARAGRWLAKRRAEGATVAELAEELRLAAGTVLRWSSDAKRSRALVPVEVVSTERTVSVVSPSGFRLEGLSVSEAAALLQALG
jgi:hypothetical protein